jgi:transcription elongation factor SPT6
VATTLIVDKTYEYADLDELIVSHIHAMARRVEDLMNHEKFKKDDDELRTHNSTLQCLHCFKSSKITSSEKFLVNFVSANPSKSIYGFTLNRKRPGHFNLSFLARKGSSIRTWVCTNIL